eukprot:CAMPEP_0194360152 /NCGR_PEP_ID=MMETSP0174-20130528/7424_1 /TAXON_ID=216777 /ORGANISM="Proboscia alata, Strain PI-D3" /LENGTH=251 /DNA_ID=CAMNT_0039131443 /DNA_START=130 /DNA_END=885 /DNA_ORIENTATION=+
MFVSRSYVILHAAVVLMISLLLLPDFASISFANATTKRRTFGCFDCFDDPIDVPGPGERNGDSDSPDTFEVYFKTNVGSTVVKGGCDEVGEVSTYFGELVDAFDDYIGKTYGYCVCVLSRFSGINALSSKITQCHQTLVLEGGYNHPDFVMNGNVLLSFVATDTDATNTNTDITGSVVGGTYSYSGIYGRAVVSDEANFRRLTESKSVSPSLRESGGRRTNRKMQLTEIYPFNSDVIKFEISIDAKDWFSR